MYKRQCQNDVVYKEAEQAWLSELGQFPKTDHLMQLDGCLNLSTE